MEFHLVNVFIATTPEDYRPFYDAKWSKLWSKHAQGHPELDSLFMTLLLNWKSAIYASGAPFFMVDGLKGFHDGFVNSPQPTGSTHRLANLILERLLKDIPQVVHEPPVLNEISLRAIGIANELDRIQRENPIRLSLAEVWREFLEVPGFVMMLWGSQRTCFVSVHCTYEDFLVGVIGMKRGDPNYRKPEEKKFRMDIVGTLGAGLLPTVWTNETIVNSRLARNCLSHRCGKMSNELRKRKHTFHLEDDCLQILPKDLREQYGSMKVGVEAVVRSCRPAEPMGDNS